MVDAKVWALSCTRAEAQERETGGAYQPLGEPSKCCAERETKGKYHFSACAVPDWNFFFIETLTAPAGLSVHVCTLNTIFPPALQPKTIQRGCLFIVAKSKLGRHRGHYKFLDGLSKYSKRGLPLRASGSGFRNYKSLLKGRGMKNEVGKLTPSDYSLSVGATHTRD